MDTTTNIAGLLDIRSQKSDGSESLKIMKKKIRFQRTPMDLEMKVYQHLTNGFTQKAFPIFSDVSYDWL